MSYKRKIFDAGAVESLKAELSKFVDTKICLAKESEYTEDMAMYNQDELYTLVDSYFCVDEGEEDARQIREGTHE